MKAAVLTAAERIEVRELERPRVEAHQVLVKLKACGICTLEQRLFTGHLRLGYPVVPGHEASGVVVEVGTSVYSGIPVGAHVALDLVARCGACHYCRTGRSNLCLNRFSGRRSVLGGFGELVAVDASQVFSIPDHLAFDEAAFAEPLSCCLRSLRAIDLALAEDLLVLGAGPMGQLHVQLAARMGARVFVSDPDHSRLEMARSLGAFAAVDPSREDPSAVVRTHTEGRGVDACVVTSPAPAALQTAFQAIAKGGRINIYTAYDDEPALPVDANTIHRSEVRVLGTEGRTPQDFCQAVRLLSFGFVNVRPLISRKVGFGEIEAGMRAALASETYRVLLEHESV
ncbi:MAG TPA: zinc-binding dehydrogenase [Spirochaetia bacterium]|nr:zinc-binding dehydrogenase [Spirochaetia bacterium]